MFRRIFLNSTRILYSTQVNLRAWAEVRVDLSEVNLPAYANSDSFEQKQNVNGDMFLVCEDMPEDEIAKYREAWVEERTRYIDKKRVDTNRAKIEQRSAPAAQLHKLVASRHVSARSQFYISPVDYLEYEPV